MRNTRNFLVILIFSTLTVLMLYPLVLKISRCIPAFFSTDEPYGVLWDLWRIRYCIYNKLTIFKTEFINYPFGMKLYQMIRVIGPFFFLINLILVLCVRPIIAYNLQIITNFILGAFFCYILSRQLTKNNLAGILSGIIFSFSPYHFARAWQHLGATYIQWMPLYFLALFILVETPSKKNMFLAGVILWLIGAFNYYDFYFMIIATFVFTVYVIFTFRFRWKKFNILKNIGGVFLLASILTLPSVYPALRDIARHSHVFPSAYNPYYRPFEDLFTQSAKPLSYLLPSTEHPIFGKFTKHFVGSPLWGVSYTEHQLYLGWTTLLLALYAIKVWRKRKKRLRSTNYELQKDKDEQKDNFYIGFFILLAGVAWFFSQPPWWRIGSIKIYMPSFFMYKILPMFRAYCRFGIVVMLAVSVLAGFGLKFLLERFKAQKTKILVTSLFCGLVLFEFWNWPPYKVIDVSKAPQVYYWLREKKGDFAIAEYPLDVEGPNEMYKFYQIFHQHPIINGTIPGTYANRVAQKIIKLSEPKTASILKWMGVKYVLVHREDYLKTELVEQIEELKKIPQNPYLKFVRSFPPQKCPSKIMCTQKTGPIDVYEVEAEPIKPSIND